MSLINKDFTARDFTASFERALIILHEDVPELTDYNHSDAGISLTRLACKQTDLLNFYVDESFIETSFPLAEFKQSIINCASIVDWKPKLAATAYSTLRLTRIEAMLGQSVPTTVPQFMKGYRSDGVSYVVMTENDFPAEDSTLDVYIRQGVVNTVTLTINDFIADFDNTGRLRYNLGPNVAADSLTMVENVLILEEAMQFDWEEVDSFWRSTSEDRHFMLELYADSYNGVRDTVFLVLGDGDQGVDTTLGSFTITYLTTEGTNGNCGSGVITEIEPAYEAYYTISNPITATGGAGAEGRDSFRRRVPEATRTQRRGLTKYDYKAMIETISGVARCQAVDRNYRDLFPWEYVSLFIVPEGRGIIPDQLLTSIKTKCGSWGHLGDWNKRYILFEYTPLLINFDLRIGLITGAVESTVKAAINSALQTFFSLENSLIDLNLELDFDTIHNTVSRVSGVSFVEFVEPYSQDITVDIGELPTLGTVTITVVE